MRCPICEVGNLDYWAEFQSVVTNNRVTLRFRDEDDAIRSLRSAAVWKHQPLPFRQCSICQHKVELTGALT